ncbi:MAG: 3-methyl-2-oxobutanoate hydroxymethyltransferase [Calditrichaeota bacterium]|nr:MAG: 3-methyl-2-oxobutanoate hydroxymethyltransferase [Calditrichota bacterium]
MEKNKITLPYLHEKKSRGVPITMLTAYDYPGAKQVDLAGIDMILVGDSLAMVVLGYDSTVHVTMEDMLHHCKAVNRGARRAFLVGDMPFLSYQADVRDAVYNAGRFIQEAGMDAVKLEGGKERATVIRAISEAGIPVVGHLGLTPQSHTKLGGYKVQSKTAEGANLLLENALAIEQAGCSFLVFEMVPARIAEYISKKLTIPTIGIGAGNGCDGQVLVYHDMLGINSEFNPKFLKQFASLGKDASAAIKDYSVAVESRAYPAVEHSFMINEEEYAAFMAMQDE